MLNDWSHWAFEVFWSWTGSTTLEKGVSSVASSSSSRSQVFLLTLVSLQDLQKLGCFQEEGFKSFCLLQVPSHKFFFKILLVTGYLGSPSLLLSILWIPFLCLVWPAFPPSFSLPSLSSLWTALFWLFAALFSLSFAALFLLFGQPSFYLVFTPFFMLWKAFFFLLVDSPLLTVRCPFFYCFTALFLPLDSPPFHI